MRTIYERTNLLSEVVGAPQLKTFKRLDSQLSGIIVQGLLLEQRGRLEDLKVLSNNIIPYFKMFLMMSKLHLLGIK